MQRVKKKRSGRELNSYDLQTICWKESLSDNQKHAWNHSNAATHVWSGAAVDYLSSVTDERFEKLRDEYRAYQRNMRGAGELIAVAWCIRLASVEMSDRGTQYGSR
ncbi:hypothetical protein [Rhodococcus sp. MALMAid1271]|uniref:hypothetical protein n=1 Tax=Rhodococcus sp. MALMAid1271 TaxID=3411744 RepID=UPI003B9F8446